MQHLPTISDLEWNAYSADHRFTLRNEDIKANGKVRALWASRAGFAIDAAVVGAVLTFLSSVIVKHLDSRAIIREEDTKGRYAVVLKGMDRPNIAESENFLTFVISQGLVSHPHAEAPASAPEERSP